MQGCRGRNGRKRKRKECSGPPIIRKARYFMEAWVILNFFKEKITYMDTKSKVMNIVQRGAVVHGAMWNFAIKLPGVPVCLQAPLVRYGIRYSVMLL